MPKRIRLDAPRSSLMARVKALEKTRYDVDKPYEDMTKNELVRVLNMRGIQHNKRWLKGQLIEALEAYDKEAG